MFKFLLICSLVILSGCAGINSIDDVEPVKRSDSAKAAIKIISIQVNEKSFDIRLRFEEWSDFPGLAQEITFNNSALVEYFDIKDGEMTSTFDKHSATGIKAFYVRRMRVYPASVEGVDYNGSFAQLPSNKDGSVITNISPRFNENYQKKHKTQGTIVDDDRENSIFWTIIFDHGVLTIILPDNSRVTIGNYTFS